MPIYELASNLIVAGGAGASGTNYYVGLVNMAGFNQLSCQASALGSVTGTIVISAEIGNDQANWAPTGVAGMDIATATPTVVKALLNPATGGAGFARIKVAAPMSSLGTLAIVVNLYNQ